MAGAARRLETVRPVEETPLEARPARAVPGLVRRARTALAWLGAALTLALGWSAAVPRGGR